jgi:hypothetical protein
MLKKVLRNLVVILVVLLLQAGVSLAEKGISKTGDPAWDTLSQVKKDWMLKLYDIVVVDRPELKPAADESLEWRLKEMEYDTKKFQHMSDKHPDMIIRDKGLYAFANLEWFPEFSEELSRKDPAFADLEKKIKALKEELSKSKSLKTLEEFINNLNKDEKHKEKFKRFTAELARVQKILTSNDAKMTRKKE